MFKKVISTALALTMILGLTACGSTVGSGTPETTTTAEAAKAATDETLERRWRRQKTPVIRSEL